MIFNGDVGKYHPADAIMFLSQLDINGIFSIVVDQRVIALCFRNGFIIDAHSSRGDLKILQALIARRHVSVEQVQRIRAVQSETGLMPLRTILSQLNFFPLSAIADVLMMGMQEVLLEMFLLEQGSFHFTDAKIDLDGADTRIDARVISLRIAVQADELREFEKSIITLDRAYNRVEETTVQPLSADGKLVFRLAAGCKTIRQLIDTAPLSRHTAMELIKAQIESGQIVLLPLSEEETVSGVDITADPLFRVFRQAMKKLMMTTDPLKQLEALVSYGKNFYDGMLLLTARDNELVHCTRILRQPDQGFVQRTSKGELGSLDQDPMMSAAWQSGVGFIGEVFRSSLIEGLIGFVPKGECALIPIATQGRAALFLYMFSKKQFSGVSPQHYLELLSWMPTSGNQRVTSRYTAMIDQPAAMGMPAPPPEGVTARLVEMIDDLPPMPTIVIRALELLSDPESSLQALEGVIERDPALVSKLIRVSNSVLYGGFQSVGSLQQALARLGSKITKSLVVASAMQSYFLEVSPGVKVWSHVLWRHCAECGLAARRIATIMGADDPEEAFVGGMLHDIGKLAIMLTDADAYRRIQALQRKDSLSSIEAEKQVIGADHGDIGGKLMGKWNMPESVQVCAKFHHAVDLAGDENRIIAATSAYANLISHCYGFQGKTMTVDTQAEMEFLIHTLGLTDAQNSALVMEVATDFQNSEVF